MNYLVYLDAKAGELEKILSGVKTMLIKEIDHIQSNMATVNPGDHLYFLRDHEDNVVHVKATVIRVLLLTNPSEEDLVNTLKEMQPKLRLTEGQYNDWIAKGKGLFVEIGLARKIDLFQIDSAKIQGRSNWISFTNLWVER